MQIQLTRNITVRCVRVIATLAFPAHRPIESALIRWIEGQAAAGREISAAQVCDRQGGLLPGRPLVLGQRLLNVAAQLKLVEADRGWIRGLSEIGRQALAEEKIYVPERCTWSLYFAEDPLLIQPLVHFAVHQEPTAHQEAGRGQDAKPKRTFSPLPDILARLRGRTLELPSVERPLVRIDELEQQCEPAPATVLQGELLISEGSGASSLVRGTAGDAQVSVHRTWPELSFWPVFFHLLTQQELLELWNKQAAALRRRFSEVAANGQALRSFRQDLTLRRPTLGTLGEFAATTVADVPIVAAADADAQSWLDWLLLDEIHGFCFADQYRARGEKVAQRFSAFQVQVPAQQELASRVRAALGPQGNGPIRPQSQYWHLRAPLDLDLEVRP